MNALNNLRVGTKITAASAGILIFLAAIGAVGVLALSNAKDDFATYRTLARQTNEVGRIQATMLETQLHAKTFLLTGNEDSAREVDSLASSIAKQIEEAKALFPDPALFRTVERMGAELREYQETFAKVMELQAVRNESVNTLNELGPKMEKALNTVMDSAYNDGDTEGAYLAGMAGRYFLAARVQSTRFLTDGTAESAENTRKELKSARDSGNGMLAKLTDMERRRGAMSFLALQRVYMTEFEKVVTATNSRDELVSHTLETLGPTVNARVEQLKASSIRNQDSLGAEATANMDNASTMTVGAALAATLLGLLSALLIGRGLSRPIVSMTAAMTRLAGGDRTVDVPGLDRGDEIGGMAKSVEVFKESLIRADQLALEQAAGQEARQRRAEKIDALTHDFDRLIVDVLSRVSSAATQLHATAQGMSATAEQTTRQASAVADASNQATANVETVAAAAEELSSSIQEISRQVSQSNTIAGAAVATAQKTDATVRGLVDAAQRIGEVVQLINDIASQTNLLALNATIEAARAGEAGKGFAVVATEVKNLANQTAAATEEIASQIAAVQASTGNAVQAVRGIGATLDEVDSIAGSVAAVMSQQDATTGEILNAVVETSKAAHEVSERIARVSTEAAMNGENANGVRGVAAELAKGVASLSGTLIRAVRTATQEVDRRLWPRYAVDRPCHFDTAEGSVTTLRLLDLSQRGARIATVPPLAAGTRGKLTIEGYPHPLTVVSVTSRNGELHLRFTLSDAEQSAFDIAFPKLIAGARELDAAS